MSDGASVVIETRRLQLSPLAPQHILALIEAPDRFPGLSGFAAAPGLREFFVSDELSTAFLESLRALHVADPWTFGFSVVDRDRRMVVGGAGFKGRPDAAGVAEIAYGIVPDFEGRGYATEAAGGIIEWAINSGLVQTLRAHTLPLPNASTRVLVKCGFSFAGDVIDPDDGPVWRWERLASTPGDGEGSPSRE